METYNGHVRSPADAIILFEACRLGLLPRVQRRLSEKERQSIKSGSIFVWDEREAGMRRWTDGKSWSASRVSGSFLTYREMEGKRGGGSFAPPVITGHPLGAPSDSDSDGGMGEDGPDGYRYKPDGLMKQSFSITTSNNQKLHLISYFARSHPTSTALNQPSNDPQLKHIRPAPGMYPESTVHEQQNVPVVTQRPMIPAPYSPSQQPPMNNGYRTGSMSGPSQQQQQQQQPHPMAYGLHTHAGSPYGWPPSPVSTPPTSFPQAIYGHPGALPLPPAPISQGSPMHGGLSMYADNLLPAPTNPTTMGSPMGYDRSPLANGEASLQAHRGSVSSPRAMHLLPQASPRMPYGSPVGQPPHDSPRFSSPATSITSSYATRSSSRPAEGAPWDVPGPLPAVNGSSSPGGSNSLDVQDIPNAKLGFNEDMRALRQLDRAFIH